MLGLHILLGDEFLYIVDCDGIVNIAAGARILAEFRTYAAADGGEGVLLLYKLKSLLISALSRELYIALNGNVSRAVCLTGCSTGLNYVFAVFAPVFVPVLLCPKLIIGRFGAAYLQGLCRAQLLAETQSVHLTVFNTLTAGDALILIDLRTVVGFHYRRCVEQPAAAQRQAGALAAVADAADLARAVGI